MKWYERFYQQDFMEVVGFASPEQTEKEIHFVKNTLKWPKTAKILDLCCGYGRHTYLLAKSSDYHIAGLDLSDHYLDIAKTKFSHPRVTYVKGDMRNIPFENYFDAENEREIFKVHVLEKGILKETSGYNIRLYSFPGRLAKKIPEYLGKYRISINQIPGNRMSKFKGMGMKGQALKRMTLAINRVS